MKIGLFFGSFNPIHIGHLIIANFISENTDLEQVWFVVSPHNPLKNKDTLANDYDRLHLVTLATANNPNLIPSDIEFNLPKPSYTVDTLAYAKDKFPKNTFVLIMGGDNVETLHKWKNYEYILAHYEIYVYNRPNTNVSNYQNMPNIKFFDVPLMDISSTFIRKQIQLGRSIRYLVADKVQEELEKSDLYK
jgi:nicotinate-nucleotide adenylyltransferase